MSKRVRSLDVLLNLKQTSSKSLQGCERSPLLLFFTQTGDKLDKATDLLRRMEMNLLSSVCFRRKKAARAKWLMIINRCEESYLQFNTGKAKVMVIDFRSKQHMHNVILIKGRTFDFLHFYKYSRTVLQYLFVCSHTFI